MKINRNYRFVLAVLDNEKINAGEIPGEAMPLEIITVDENGVNIR